MINVVRSGCPEKDKGLERKTSYDGVHIKRQLKEDFRSKCYLCETDDQNTPFEIDHLKPQAENAFPELAYDWGNLFYVCRSCNKSRKASWSEPYEKADGAVVSAYPKGGLLDCTKDDVEARLLQELSFGVSMLIAFGAREDADAAAKNTAMELQWLHAERENHVSLVREIHLRVTMIYERILQLNGHETRGEEESVLRGKVVLRELLSKRQPFTALLRSYFTVESGRLPLFLADTVED